MKRYRTLNEYLRETFGEKIYKVSLDGGFTCPNRDGTLSKKGCIFCSEKGSGEFTSGEMLNISAQIEKQLKLIENKFPKGKVIAYFQNFTGTYGNTEYLRKIYYEALAHPRVIGIAIATRPDCLGAEVLELLDEINKKYFLWVELGLQTINDQVARIINRQYPLEIYVEVCNNLNYLNIKFVTHIIVGLPYENKDDPLKTAIFANKCKTWGIKIHLLHVLQNTNLEKLYNERKFNLLTKETYIEKVATILGHLSKDVIIHRITGDGDRKTLIGPIWSLNKKRVLNEIDKYMEDKNISQGSFYEK